MTSIATLLLLSTADAASAYAVIQLESPTFTDTSCAAPTDRTSVELSVDGRRLQVAFADSFSAARCPLPTPSDRQWY